MRIFIYTQNKSKKNIRSDSAINTKQKIQTKQTNQLQSLSFLLNYDFNVFLDEMFILMQSHNINDDDIGSFKNFIASQCYDSDSVKRDIKDSNDKYLESNIKSYFNEKRKNDQFELVKLYILDYEN